MAYLVQGLREAIWQNYHVHEAAVSGDPGRAEWMKKSAKLNFFPHLKGPTILEIACGPGHLLDALRDEGYGAIGSDLSPKNVQTARGRGHFVTNINFLTDLDGRAKRAFPPFDSVIMMGIIEHIPKDELLPSLRNVKKLLRPGGTLVVSTQNMDALIGVHYRYMDLTHELGFTRESMKQLGSLVFPKTEVFPWQDPPPGKPKGLYRGIRYEILEKFVRPLWKKAYRAHIRMVGGHLYSCWYDVTGLVAVFYND